ncbi:MAG: DUF3883 domain-containing protein [Candidatus Adiutrix sp.]|jgi:hypothetical protein|nr:DUF3883 domain-containing protein [Candidatus Adiutrix sp.]
MPVHKIVLFQIFTSNICPKLRVGRNYRRELKINAYEWTSRQNAVAPYDFELTASSGEQVLLDVKSTSGDFLAPLHISMAEILPMADVDKRYDLYRVYSLTERGGKLRVAEDMRKFAISLLDIMAILPNGLRVDGISVDPAQLPFGNEQELLFPDEVD